MAPISSGRSLGSHLPIRHRRPVDYAGGANSQGADWRDADDAVMAASCWGVARTAGSRSSRSAEARRRLRDIAGDYAFQTAGDVVTICSHLPGDMPRLRDASAASCVGDPQPIGPPVTPGSTPDELPDDAPSMSGNVLTGETIEIERRADARVASIPAALVFARLPIALLIAA